METLNAFLRLPNPILGFVFLFIFFGFILYYNHKKGMAIWGKEGEMFSPRVNKRH